MLSRLLSPRVRRLLSCALVAAIALPSLPASASAAVRQSAPVVWHKDSVRPASVVGEFHRGTVGRNYATSVTNLWRYDTSEGTPLMCDWDGNGTKTPGALNIDPVDQAFGALYDRFFLYINTLGGSGWDERFFFDPAPQFQPGAQVLCGDWDGDGTDALGVKTGNVWWLSNTNFQTPDSIVLTYGDAGDVGLVGDWDGNGTDTPAVVRVDPGIRHYVDFYVRNTNTTGTADGVFSMRRAGTGHPHPTSARPAPPGDFTPVVGDWDANGRDDIGVVEGNRWQLKVINGSLLNTYDFSYGYTGDVFLVG